MVHVMKMKPGSQQNTKDVVSQTRAFCPTPASPAQKTRQMDQEKQDYGVRGMVRVVAGSEIHRGIEWVCLVCLLCWTAPWPCTGPDSPVLGCRSKSCHWHFPKENNEDFQRNEFTMPQPEMPPHPQPRAEPTSYTCFSMESFSAFQLHTASQAIEGKFFPRKQNQGSHWLHCVERTLGASHSESTWRRKLGAKIKCGPPQIPRCNEQCGHVRKRSQVHSEEKEVS